MWYGFRPYVPVAQRRAQAAREVQKRLAKGQKVCPVVIEGRTIARTFWGKAWCEHLEKFSDYENRLPRGRTYVRNGSVVDLQIQPGKLTALVSGSELYTVNVTITPLPASEWKTLKTRCAGRITSVVELLQGRLSKDVIGIITDRSGGLFPRTGEIRMRCSCPDSAGMCKHIAAVLYGVGSHLDREPELLFRLRQVDYLELIDEAVADVGKQTTQKKTLAVGDLADVFGIDLAEPEVPATDAPPAPEPRATRKATKASRSTPAGDEPATAKPPRKTKKVAPPKAAGEARPTSPRKRKERS